MTFWDDKITAHWVNENKIGFQIHTWEGGVVSPDTDQPSPGLKCISIWIYFKSWTRFKWPVWWESIPVKQKNINHTEYNDDMVERDVLWHKSKHSKKTTVRAGTMSGQWRVPISNMRVRKKVIHPCALTRPPPLSQPSICYSSGSLFFEQLCVTLSVYTISLSAQREWMLNNQIQKLVFISLTTLCSP